ncbi:MULTISPECIES: type VII secretion protein EssC [unclassified Enterococcus]|uniref:type VII secretion protein EssC n=1 Tax=unclassified Enterococcus TaxID=2608891 RepID=UPI0015532007|nr:MULTISPECIES: type VII secretion protein EssC [unclassified Enterococcus]MBS7576458.1 type VII secretion protein EssC [Enterococcus sp. MMGLQ5-2]MBS7583690.1 type VII secretion protein EssC [Enterococcus sp. MMGLQ5-1]NPD11551.1 type VII secretion protein EssC [Enterococcus sp. MMGLQ5-1]NPD36295.1 type VII secretion protein EssC [Enterococcus sp. MMGLQ5-2]
MQVTLITIDSLKQMILPRQKTGKYPLLNDECSEEEALIIEGDGEFWCLKHQPCLRFINRKMHIENSIRLDELRLFEMVDSQQQMIHLLVEPLTIDRMSFKKYQVKLASSIQIGRGLGNQIRIDYSFISNKHAILHLTKSGWFFEDCSSLNGSYINGKRVAGGIRYSLVLGDIIFIMGFKLIIGSDFISFNSADQSVSLDADYLLDYEMTGETADYQNFPLQAVPSYVYPKRRLYQLSPSLVLTIDPPTALPTADEQPFIFLIGPALTMVIASISTGTIAASQSIQSGNFKATLPMMIMAISMLLGSVLWPLLLQKYRLRLLKKQLALREAKYRAYLSQVEAQIMSARQQQHKVLLQNYQSFIQLRQNWLECPTDIWGKQLQQADFLTVRVGLGALPLALDLQYPKRVFSLEEDLLLDAMYQFVEADYQIKNAPITLSLTDFSLTGVIADQRYRREFAADLIFKLAFEYRYDELKMIFVYQSPDYDFVRWLPHVWSGKANFRFLAADEISLKWLIHQLEQIIWQLTEEKKGQLEQQKTPHYLIFLLSDRLTLSTSLISQLTSEPIAQYFSIIQFVSNENRLVPHCNQILQISPENSQVRKITDACHFTRHFKADLLPEEADDFRQLAVSLFNTRLKIDQTKNKLPEMLTFLQLFKVSQVEHLNILERWQSYPLEHSLETPIGINAQGELLMLDLHDKADGPHGLIAGMTGSGKSELIITYILSLAVNYHPNQVAFLLIDYKGGGLAKAFQNLPHTAGIITNLDGGMVYRAMIAIESELRRRQAIFNEVSQAMGISNLDIDHYQMLYRNHKVSQPLPHLLIISDEFAELKAQQPDFMSNLISTARIGRSLGVHLILATQKPSGVVDEQIWSNSRFRIALKVQERADSLEMLKRTEAAELKVRGRFYLQIGYNEKFELAQSAWAGANYLKTGFNDTLTGKKIIAINLNGQAIGEWTLTNQEHSTDVRSIKQLDAVRAHIQRLAKEAQIYQQPLWLPELKAVLIYDDLRVGILKEVLTYPLQILIGMYDAPKSQAQLPLFLTIDSSGHIAILGSVGSGKAMLIQTMIYDLIINHSPLKLQLYIFDYLEEILPDFKAAPQVRAIIYPNEVTKMSQIFKSLLNELKVRKQKIVKTGLNYRIFQQNEALPPPNIVLIIHHFAQFCEQSYIDDSELLYLLREGAKYGIHLIISGLCLMDIRYSWQQYFPHFIVLQMNEMSEYSVIFGKTEGLSPANFIGRGLIKLDEIYEFQAASIAQTTNQATIQIREMIRSQKIKWST